MKSVRSQVTFSITGAHARATREQHNDNCRRHECINNVMHITHIYYYILDIIIITLHAYRQIAPRSGVYTMEISNHRLSVGQL